MLDKIDSTTILSKLRTKDLLSARCANKGRRTFKLRRDDLSFIGSDNRPTVEPGEFDVMIGGLKERFTLK